MDLLNYLEEPNMETYKNDYNKNEDETLWELHEIRNRIHKRIISTPKNKLNDSNIERFNLMKIKYKKENSLQLT